MTQYGFSCMTINRALCKLTDEGLLVRLQDVGMFVAEPKGQSALFEIHSIADEINARQHQHRCEVLTLEKTQTNAQQTLVLNVKEGTSISHSIMMHYENDLSVQIGDRCVNVEIVPEHLTQDYSQIISHVYLSLTVPLMEGEHIVEVVRTSAEECALLNIKEHDPRLSICRKAWSALSIASHARLPFLGSRYRLQGWFMS